MYPAILDSLAAYDEQITEFDRALDLAIQTGQAIEVVLDAYLKGTPHESISEPVQHCDDGSRSGETGDGQEASGRLSPWWFGDAAGI